MSAVVVTEVRQVFDLELPCDGCGHKFSYRHSHDTRNGQFSTDAVLRGMGWAIVPQKPYAPVFGPVTRRYCPGCAPKFTDGCTHNPPCPTWHAADGDVLVCNMGDTHLKNAYAFADGTIKEHTRKMERSINEINRLVPARDAMRAEIARREHARSAPGEARRG